MNPSEPRSPYFSSQLEELLAQSQTQNTSQSSIGSLTSTKFRSSKQFSRSILPRRLLVNSCGQGIGDMLFTLWLLLLRVVSARWLLFCWLMLARGLSLIWRPTIGLSQPSTCLLSRCDLGAEHAFTFQVPNKANTPLKRERNTGSYAPANRLKRP